MKSLLNFQRVPSAVALLAFAAISFLPTESEAADPAPINIDGSSTVFPIMNHAAKVFREQNPDAQIIVNFSGTSGGFRKFVAGETDIQDASRPITQAEIDAAKAAGIEFIEIPIAFDALTVVVHPENEWLDAVKISELKKLWGPAAERKITRWNQVNPEWPDQELQLYGAGADSGTYDYFTEVVVGDSKKSRMDYIGSEDDEVLVDGVSKNEYALGFLPYAYVVGNEEKVKAVPVHRNIDPKTGQQLEGAPVSPSNKAILQGIYTPLGRPLFLYVSTKSLAENPEVGKFLSFFLENAPEFINDVGYLPLPHVAYEQGAERLEEKITGTAFGGKIVSGVSIYDIFSLKPE